MKKKLVIAGLLVSLLALGLAFTSCDNGTTENEYTLAWGAFYGNEALIRSTIATQGWAVSEVSDGAYATGATANAIYVYCLNNIGFIDGGAADGSFEDLLNYTARGVGLPPNLKAALATQKAFVPIAGIFDNGISATVFYVTKK